MVLKGLNLKSTIDCQTTIKPEDLDQLLYNDDLLRAIDISFGLGKTKNGKALSRKAALGLLNSALRNGVEVKLQRLKYPENKLDGREKRWISIITVCKTNFKKSCKLILYMMFIHINFSIKHSIYITQCNR